MTTVVSYGGGTNSTAMLIGLQERGERPDIILFADTGGELPETYWHVQSISEWCLLAGFPPITTVKSSGVTLEEDCITRGALPSVAYGFKTCSMRWKVQPQEKYLRSIGVTEYTKLIGIDADETRRAKEYDGTRYPLIEWGWGRDECVEAIDRAGLPQPGKSACFFCPSSKPKEILFLKKRHPDLLKRALALEANAELHTIKGLGRNWAWKDFVAFSDAQLDLFPALIEEPCGCYDGDGE